MHIKKNTNRALIVSLIVHIKKTITSKPRINVNNQIWEKYNWGKNHSQKYLLNLTIFRTTIIKNSHNELPTTNWTITWPSTAFIARTEKKSLPPVECLRQEIASHLLGVAVVSYLYSGRGIEKPVECFLIFIFAHGRRTSIPDLENCFQSFSESGR